MITIVIPIHNNWAQTHQLLFDIYQKISDCKIVIVDDQSTDPDVADASVASFVRS